MHTAHQTQWCDSVSPDVVFWRQQTISIAFARSPPSTRAERNPTVGSSAAHRRLERARYGYVATRGAIL
eukprot:1182088-Prorocentrum_minimum.AAC.3